MAEKKNLQTLKCQFHSHCSDDPVDAVKHSAKELIDEAARLKYQVLAITLHRKFHFSKKLSAYAEKKGILLLPGIEFEIDHKHILCINAKRKIEDVDSFDKLRMYRNKHPDSLIIAPHPFYPGPCLKNLLIENIDCFDAIELSWAQLRSYNPNKKAVAVGLKYDKTMVATSDCHILSHLDSAYCFVKCAKNPKAIVKAIRANKVQNFSPHSNIFKIARFFVQLSWQTFWRNRCK